MPFSEAGLNQMLDAMSVTVASLHTGDPGATGINELTGGTPAYARVPITFGAAAAGNRDSTNQPVFDVPAGSNITHWGIWDGPTFKGGFPLSAAESYTGQGKYTLSDADLQGT